MKTPWYKLDAEDVARGVFEHARDVEAEQNDIREAFYNYAQLYSNREEPGLGGVNRTPYRSGWSGVTENLIQSVIDTATSLIGKSRPKLAVLTEGAEWDLQLLAEQVEQYLFGLFHSTKVHPKMTMVFRDACIFGTGCLKLCIRDNEVYAERVLVDEIVVDEAEVPSGELPWHLHQVKMVSREVLQAQYPEKSQAIESAGLAHRAYTRYPRDVGLCLVIESWYRATGDTPGRHTICVDGACLLDEGWDFDWFPFVFYRWSSPLTGFYGQGLAEALLGFQIRLNDLNDFIQKCQDLVAVPLVMTPTGTNLAPSFLTNEIARVVEYTGPVPPQFHTPQALNAEIYQYKESLKTAAFEFAGISKMAAQATRPEGIEAAVALRELSDNQSQRFSTNQQTFEDAFLEVGEKQIALTRWLDAHGGAPPMYMSERWAAQIDWPAADMDRNKFVMQVQPSSILSDLPSGRLQRVTELRQYNVPLTDSEFRRLLGHPDLKASDAEATSAEDFVRWTINEMVKTREYRAPEAYHDLELCVTLGTAQYRILRMRNADDEILELVRDFINQADTQLTQLRQQEQAAAMAMQNPQAAGSMPMMGSSPEQLPSPTPQELA